MDEQEKVASPAKAAVSNLNIGDPQVIANVVVYSFFGSIAFYVGRGIYRFRQRRHERKLNQDKSASC